MTVTEFEILARSLHPRLFKTADRIVGSRDDAADIVQDVMLRLWSMRDGLDEYRSVEALAVLITRHMAINHLRRSRPERHIELSESDAAVPSAEDIVIGRQTAEYVDSVLSSLPDTQQTLLRLRHIEGYDNATIAAMLGSSEGAVRTALSRARRSVAQMFSVLND